MSKEEYRRVNRLLDKQPNWGPFPADMLLPWAIIAFFSYLIFKSFLQFSWVWTGAIACWGCSTWWVLTAKNSWKYLSKFISTPHWVRAITYYNSPLLGTKKRKHGKSRHKTSQKSIW